MYAPMEPLAGRPYHSAVGAIAYIDEVSSAQAGGWPKTRGDNQKKENSCKDSIDNAEVCGYTLENSRLKRQPCLLKITPAVTFNAP